MALQPGQILNQRYQIKRAIQSGGMGSVYEAVDCQLADSPCAVKEVNDSALSGPDSEYMRTRFLEEMKVLAGLEHPAIPRVRDFLQVGSSAYLVMELVVGESLLDELETNAPTPEEVVNDMASLLDTLAYLHERGLLHRDIKPANVLRDRRNGQVKLVDFGLARAAGGDNHTVVGTMGYCAPEQLMGKAERRSDLFSVGVTMAHLITGQPPQGVILYEPLRLDFGARYQGLADIIARATDPCLDNRYPDALAMREALLAWQGQSTVGIVTPLPAKRRRRPLAVLLGLGALKLAVLAGFWAFRSPAAIAASSTPQTPTLAAAKLSAAVPASSAPAPTVTTPAKLVAKSNTAQPAPTPGPVKVTARPASLRNAARPIAVPRPAPRPVPVAYRAPRLPEQPLRRWRRR